MARSIILFDPLVAMLNEWELKAILTRTLDKEPNRYCLFLLTLEFINLLSGKAHDHDRHGAQERILREVLGGDVVVRHGLFGHGCMALRDPSDDEKRSGARIVCELLKSREDTQTNLVLRAHELIRQERSRTNAHPSYLVSIERSLLALNDYLGLGLSKEHGRLQPPDVAKCLAAAFRSGEVDPVFSDAIAAESGYPAALLRVARPS